MLHLVLADAELEPIPDNLRNHKSLRGNAETLLDASDHHSMMVNLYDGRRRGRPDITHLFLLLANESIACCEGMLRAYVHTRHNRVIYVEPETRIIKHYDRFKGLIYSLFEKGHIPPVGKVLMMVKQQSLSELISELPGKRVVLSQHGTKKPLSDVFERDTVCIIGGFPSGNFISNMDGIADEIVSIYGKELTASTAIMEVIVAYENTFITKNL